MAEKKKRQGLGRGLSALMADVAVDEAVPDQPARGGAGVDTIAIDRIEPNPDQPRRDFDDAALKDLANSIREKGVIQPLVLRTSPRKAGRYEIVAGERRWRASQLAQLHEVPAVIREFDDSEVLEVAIIENIQREDLNPVEEALGYQQLMDRFGRTQEAMADALGKSRSYIANSVRLLGLPDEVLTFLRKGALSAGHARALVTAEDPVGLAKEIVKRGLSVRETEKLAKGPAKTKSGPGPITAPKDADTRALEADLGAALRMKVAIEHNAGGESGQVVIKYASLEQLDDLCRKLTAAS